MRVGILVELAGIPRDGLLLRAGIGWATLAVTLAVFGFGAGMASSQLTNVVLSEVPHDRAPS